MSISSAPDLVEEFSVGNKGAPEARSASLNVSSDIAFWSMIAFTRCEGS
jgi:hypothetical protein